CRGTRPRSRRAARGPSRAAWSGGAGSRSRGPRGCRARGRPPSPSSSRRRCRARSGVEMTLESFSSSYHAARGKASCFLVTIFAMRDKERRRHELLRAAREVFARKGYHEARVEDIVAAARVAKGTFYLYFRDKRSVFVELVDSLFARMATAILHVDISADVEGQVKHNIRAIIAVLLDDPLVTQLLLSYAAVPDQKFLEKIRSFYDGVKQMLATALQSGQEMGIVVQGDT